MTTAPGHRRRLPPAHDALRRRRRGPGRRGRLALRRPVARAAAARGRRGRGRPVEPRRPHRDRPGPAVVAALDDHPGADRHAAPAKRGRPSSSARTVTSSTTCTWWTTATTTWITVEPGTAGALRDWLDRMRFMLRVEVADVTADWAVVGGRSALAVRAAGGRCAADLGRPVAGAGPEHGVVRAVAEEDHPGGSGSFAEVLVPRARLAEVLDGRPAGRHAGPPRRCGSPPGARGWAWRPTTGPSRTRSTGCAPPSTWRRAATAGRRRWPGCTTSGRPPRRLVFLHLDGSEHTLPAHGDPVLLGERQVGLRHDRRPAPRARARSPSPW